MKKLLIIACMLMSGCATIEEHKTEIITVGIAVGLALAVNALEHDGPRHRVKFPEAPCVKFPDKCY